MAPPPHPKEYHDLMERNGDGHYLYNPQRFKDFHPGSVGYFDSNGDWYHITDILEKDDRFEPVDHSLAFAEPFESMWKTVSSGSEAETSFGLDAGLSGALSGAPVDVSANAKNKSGSTGQAALITTGVVKKERFQQGAHPIFKDWVKRNLKKLTTGQYADYIKEHGLYAIYTTWSTEECAIKLKSGYSRDTGGGVAVGATSIGKIGASGSSLKHLESEGWRTYKAKEDDQGLVVVYSGMKFNFHTFQKFHSSLKVTETATLDPNVVYRPVTDENGKEVRDENGEIIKEKHRIVRDEDGKVIRTEKVDVEAEARERQRKEGSPEMEDELYFQCEPDGMSESELAAENEPSGGGVSDPELTPSNMTSEQRQEILRKIMEVKKILDKEQRQAEYRNLLEEIKKHRGSQ